MASKYNNDNKNFRLTFLNKSITEYAIAWIHALCDDTDVSKVVKCTNLKCMGIMQDNLCHPHNNTRNAHAHILPRACQPSQCVRKQSAEAACSRALLTAREARLPIYESARVHETSYE